MAVPANTKTTPQAVGNREDLHDTITRISPDSTPFLSAIGGGRGRKASAVKHEWLTEDIRKGDATRGAFEGADATITAPKTRTRLANLCKIFDEGASVSKTQEAVDSAGVPRELAHQIALKMKEIALDMEATYSGAQQYANEVADTTPRQTSGVQCFVTTAGNSNRGAGGADGTIVNTFAEAPTAGTNRTFTEAQFKDVLLGMHKNGCGGAKTAMMGPELKQAASAFTGISAIRTDTGSSKPTIIGSADIYVSDFGRITMVGTEDTFANECLIFKPEMVSRAPLRRLKRQPLSKTGDNMKTQIVAEETLVVRNPKAVGIVADLIAA